MLERLIAIEEKYNELTEKLSRPEILNNIKETLKLTKEQASLKEAYDAYQNYKKIEKDYIDQILNNKQPMYWDSYISSIPMEIIRGASNFFKEYALKNARIFRYSKNMSTGPDFRFPDDIKLEDIEWTKK